MARVARDVSCSFCGKTSADVVKLIAGPAVFICDECVALCVDILNEEAPDGWGGSLGPRTGPPAPTTTV